MPHIDTVETDMNAHTMTVTFDDDDTSVDTVIETLGQAGYTVPSHEQSGG